MIIPAPFASTEEIYPALSVLRPELLEPRFRCVYLTSSNREAERAAALVEPEGIRLCHATRLEDAEAWLRFSGSHVLLTDCTFRGGDWRDALNMAFQQNVPIAVIVAARLVDDQLWLEAVQRGAYDLVQKPFKADELRRILESACGFSAERRLSN